MTIQNGDMAPDFVLPADDGTMVQLSALRGRTVIIYFYPKDDTPGCTTQACGFRDNYAQVTAADAIVLAISPDSVESHVAFKRKFNLPFPLLADVDHAVCEAYGVWSEKTMYGKKYMGVTRSHVVVAADGRLADVQIKVTPEESIKRSLQQLTK